MSESRDSAATQAETGRTEAFSDGVLAIIITLLVFELRSPESEPGGLLSGLPRQWPLYLATATSFLYVAVIWLNYKATFKRIHSMDQRLHWANLGVLFTTALLPFPTAVVADAIQDGNAADVRTAVGLYALVGALLCLSWVVFFHHLHEHPELVEEDVAEGFFNGERTRAGVGMVLYATAGVLGYLAAPPIALVIFLALPVFYAITSQGLYELPAVRRRR